MACSRSVGWPRPQSSKTRLRRRTWSSICRRGCALGRREHQVSPHCRRLQPLCEGVYPVQLIHPVMMAARAYGRHQGDHLLVPADRNSNGVVLLDEGRNEQEGTVVQVRVPATTPGCNGECFITGQRSDRDVRGVEAPLWSSRACRRCGDGRNHEVPPIAAWVGTRLVGTSDPAHDTTAFRV